MHTRSTLTDTLPPSALRWNVNPDPAGGEKALVNDVALCLACCRGITLTFNPCKEKILPANRLSVPMYF